MKKLMIAAAIVCAAAFAQAATCNWDSAGVQIDGDFESGDGNYAQNFLVYLVNADAHTQAEVASGMKSAANLGTYLDGVAATTAATTDNFGGFASSFDIGAVDAYNAFLVILDANDASKAKYSFISDTYAATITTVQASFDYDGDQFVNALDYTTAGQTGSNWQAVPEPTSGLLLLLGVAGLALRRRRA